MERVIVAVPGAQVKDTYVLYQINIAKGDTTWTVRRRYQDFEKLHSVLKRTLPMEITPDLPPKKLRLGASKFAADFVEQRRIALEGYLIRLLAVVEPERIEALDDFLEYAEHCLERAITVLGGVTELYHVVRMLKTAADRAAAVHSKQRPAAEEGDDEGDEGGGASALAASASGAGAAANGSQLPGGGELLPTLREVVRMMSEYASILRSGCEDAEESSDATSASNTHLSSRLHAKEEETVDLRQLMAALREKRRAECDRERAALLLAAAQSRTVVAELRRVLREQALFRATTEVHRAEATRLRGADVAAWERGALAPAFAGGGAGAASSSSASVATPSLPVELQPQSETLGRAASAAQRVQLTLVSSVGAVGGSEAAAAAAFSAISGVPSFSRRPLSIPSLNALSSGGSVNDDSSAGSKGSVAPNVAADGLSVMSAASSGALSGGNLAVAVVLASAAAENAHLARLLHKLRTRAVVRRPRAPAVAPAPAAAAPAAAAAPPASSTVGGGGSGGFASSSSAATAIAADVYARAGAALPLGSSGRGFQGASAAAPAALRVGLNPNFRGVAATSLPEQAQAQQPSYGGGGGVPASPAAAAAAGLWASAASATAADPPAAATPAPSAAAALMRAKLASASASTPSAPAAAGNPFGGGGAGAGVGPSRRPNAGGAPGGNPF